MKKIVLLFVSFFIFPFVSLTLSDSFPSFPMSIYGNIKIWTTDISAWSIKIYDASNSELSNYTITRQWKYWAEIATNTALVLNDFSGNIVIKVIYNWTTYTVTQDQIDDTNKWQWCPSKAWISFVSKNCRYDITLPQPVPPSWWWGWGWWVVPAITTWTIVNHTWLIHTGWYLPPQINATQNSGGWFSAELVNAYTFAYQIWITTMPTIDQANMDGHLIRAHMAKMMVNYAIDVMWLPWDVTKKCDFDDVQNQSDEMKHYITLSCQLGIMWVGMTSFDPNGLVTRAEFWTVLSRILYWDTYNNWTLYYSDHLKILKEKWIIKNDDPSLEELRWYVMLMLMRAGK